MHTIIDDRQSELPTTNMKSVEVTNLKIRVNTFPSSHYVRYASVHYRRQGVPLDRVND